MATKWRVEFDFQQGDDLLYLERCDEAAAGKTWASQAGALRGGQTIMAKVRLYHFGGAKVPRLQVRPKPVGDDK